MLNALIKHFTARMEPRDPLTGAHGQPDLVDLLVGAQAFGHALPERVNALAAAGGYRHDIFAASTLGEQPLSLVISDDIDLVPGFDARGRALLCEPQRGKDVLDILLLGLAVR